MGHESEDRWGKGGGGGEGGWEEVTYDQVQLGTIGTGLGPGRCGGIRVDERSSDVLQKWNGADVDTGGTLAADARRGIGEGSGKGSAGPVIGLIPHGGSPR